MALDFSDLIYGYQKKVPTSRGFKRYINFDNAASTPPFKDVMDYIAKEAEWYSSVHRGSGYKSRYSTEKYELARKIIADFVSADLNNDVVIFTKNTTDSINKVSHYLDILPGETVVFTKIEHHSNELPWLKEKYFCIGLKNGGIDFEQLEEFLKNHGKVKLLAISGASNVTGITPPIYTLAEMAHQAGAKILVDGAQLIPHRPIKIFPASDPRHLDFLAFSGHKMYAPFGSGVLIGPRSVFVQKPPSQVGGGTIKGIGPAGIIWAEPPEIEEAGSPNVLGALAISKASQILEQLRWETIIQHENGLLNYALNELKRIPNLILYNTSYPDHQVGVISFNIEGLDHYSVAEYLSSTRGIGVRNGCFCARGYVQSLLKLNESELRFIQNNMAENPQQATPGMVRISFGCYNKVSEIDILLEALSELCHTPKKTRIY